MSSRRKIPAETAFFFFNRRSHWKGFKQGNNFVPVFKLPHPRVPRPDQGQDRQRVDQVEPPKLNSERELYVPLEPIADPLCQDTDKMLAAHRTRAEDITSLADGSPLRELQTTCRPRQPREREADVARGLTTLSYLNNARYVPIIGVIVA